MHILFLSDNFPPEVNAPASRTFEHAREWVKQGHEVTVITCAPNFPQGRIFEGYKNKLWQTVNMEGVHVIRVWTYITANQGFFRRTLDYFSYMVMAILAAAFVKKVDVVIGTSPQFFTACGAYLVSLYKRIPFIFELRDLWPESIKAVGAISSPRLLDYLERLELFLYRKARLVVAVTNAFKADLIRRGVYANKIFVTTNGVDLQRFTPRNKDSELVNKLGLNGKFVAGYIGTHGMAHALETLLDSSKLLQDQWPNFHLLMLGDGAAKKSLIKYAQAHEINNVTFLASVSKEEVTRYWSLLDVTIIHLKNMPLFKTVIPSKLFESMAMGIPVVHGVLGESADIVNSTQCGLVFMPQNADDLAAKLYTLRDDRTKLKVYQTNAITAVKEYDRRKLALRMLSEVTSILPEEN